MAIGLANGLDAYDCLRTAFTRPTPGYAGNLNSQTKLTDKDIYDLRDRELHIYMHIPAVCVHAHKACIRNSACATRPYTLF